jgi:hypothetical protein
MKEGRNHTEVIKIGKFIIYLKIIRSLQKIKKI